MDFDEGKNKFKLIHDQESSYDTNTEYTPKGIRTIQESDHKIYEEAVACWLEKGLKVISAWCGMIQNEDGNYIPMYMAILLPEDDYIMG